MYKQIQSKDNRIYKECQKLSQKKYRDREERYLIEGVNLIEEAVKNHAEILYFLMEEDFSSPWELPEGKDTYGMSKALFDKLAQTQTSQGILAVVKKENITHADLEQMNRCSSNFVVLDRLQDPGNIGTIIRTADGAGYAGVIMMKGTADVYSPKVVRSAAGSVFRVPIIQVEDNRELKTLISALNKKMVVTCFDTDNYYFDENLAEGIALVIGNEGNGISEELMDMADIKVKIPMIGNLESLNAAVAAGILMYEAMRGVGEDEKTIK